MHREEGIWRGITGLLQVLVSSMFLMEMIEIIISVHFRAKVK